MILMSFMVCEFKKGEACFYGEPCSIAGKPTESRENPDVAPGKRILINMKGEPSMVKDFVGGLWLSLAAILSVGFGDIFPMPQGGKMIVVAGIMPGVCHTAMSLVMMGTQFAKCCNALKREESLIESQMLLENPVQSTVEETKVWETFLKCSSMGMCRVVLFS